MNVAVTREEISIKYCYKVLANIHRTKLYSTLYFYLFFKREILRNGCLENTLMPELPTSE